MGCSYVEQATTYLLVICACLLAMGVWPVSYLRMLVGSDGRMVGWSDKREFYALHGIIGACSGSPQLSLEVSTNKKHVIGFLKNVTLWSVVV